MLASNSRREVKPWRRVGAPVALLVLWLLAPGLDAQEAEFVPGDVNGSGHLDISDSVALLGYLFRGVPEFLPAPGNADFNNSDSVDIADVVAILSYLYLGLIPPGGFPDQEPDPDPDPGGGVDPRPDPVDLPDLIPDPSLDGWTVVAPTLLGDVYYVSSSQGSDQNNGRSSTRPFQTLARAYEALAERQRSGVGRSDRLLLRRGDLWTEGLGTWSFSGASGLQPLLVSSYGDPSAPRPQIQTSGDGLILRGDARHVAVIGIDFEGRGEATGVKVAGTDSALPASILVEDCRIAGFSIGFQASRCDHVNVRRSVIHDNTTLGVFARDFTYLTLEENVIDRNGGSLTHEHNVYISLPGRRAVIRNNLITRASNRGLKFRGPQVDGLIEGNVFSGNRNAIAVQCKSPGEQNRGIVVRRNIAVQTGHDEQHGPLWITSTRDLLVEGNLLINSARFVAQSAIQLDWPNHFESEPDANWMPLEDVILRDNLVRGVFGIGLWFHGSESVSRPLDYRDVIVADNTFLVPALEGSNIRPIVRIDDLHPGEVTFQNNRYHSEFMPSAWFDVEGDDVGLNTWRNLSGEAGSAVIDPDSFADPDRDLGTYHGALGGTATLGGFLQGARLQSRHNWRTEYTTDAISAYLRAGYN